jgi:cytochrome c oxidase accessory protein FixG
MEIAELQHTETFRDRLSTVQDNGSRNWIYASKPSGKLYNYRTILTVVYLALFFTVPFIKVNGMPFVQFNFPEGKFIIFSKIFWPQDFYIFAIVMITFIVFIALFTVVYGRIFCGWICPQTIFMEMIFRRIEWWIEGSPGKQKLDAKRPWTFSRIMRKALKHFVFLLISFLIAHTFLAYIYGSEQLVKIIREPLGNHLSLFLGVVVFTFIFYIIFTYIREIVCTTICPYGRLQGVLFDKDTLLVAYDYKRGEQRTKFKKNEVRTHGDCIDCNQCVQVCPMGIDIRNGTQMDCTNCTACIDACNFMMEKVNLPQGLIRLASENGIAEGKKISFTPKIKAYTAILVFLMCTLAVLLMTRRSIDTNISRTAGQLYQEMPGNKLSNLYNAKMINKTNKDESVQLKLENINGSIVLVGKQNINLHKEAVNQATFFIQLEKNMVKARKTRLVVGVYSGGKKIQEIKTTFLGPFI